MAVFPNVFSVVMWLMVTSDPTNIRRHLFILSPLCVVYNVAKNEQTPDLSCPSPLCQSSPPSFCAAGRTPDLQSVLSVMEDANSFIYIAVMNYLPTMEFSHPKRCSLVANV